MTGVRCLLLQLFTCLCLIIYDVDCLLCWHCIADNCANDPSDSYLASEKMCHPGQTCQKTYFEMFESGDNASYKVHKSTVRGCSTDCQERDDFTNCTEIIKTSRGCVRKSCCAEDLCNDAYQRRFVFSNFISIIIIIILTVP